MRLLNVLNETNVRLNEKMATLPRLSVSQGKGVVPSDSLNANSMQASNFEKYKIVQPGHLVVNRFNAYKGALGRAPFRGIVSPDYFTGEINRSRSDDRYIEYFLRAKPTANLIERDMSGMGSGDPNSSAFSRFDVRSFLNLTIPVTDLQRQQRIADYLDRETTEIDAAVADLDKYLELLEKRRLETITSAVEGSSGPGKDKLGSEEFLKPKLGYVVIDIRTGLNPRKNFELDTPGAENWYVTVRELDGVSIRTSEATSKINDQALEMIQKRARIKVGDVLFSGTGTIGNTALVSLPPSNWGVKEGIYILTPDTSLMRSDFLLWILRSRKILSLADEMSDGSTLKSIPIEKLKRVPIPLPSLSVQKLIVNYLDRETTEIDALVTESKKLRDLLLKRRSVLITEVVTGRKQV